MKIVVKKEDGTLERLTIDGPCAVITGVGLDRLVTNDGLEHFFTKDGLYDGWGRGVSCAPDEAALIDKDMLKFFPKPSRMGQPVPTKWEKVSVSQIPPSKKKTR